MKNKILIDKINNEKTLNVYMFIFLNLLITTPFLIAVYYSRCENIFNLNDHSYVEHFLTYFFEKKAVFFEDYISFDDNSFSVILERIAK